MTSFIKSDLVLVRSDTGDGGWSLHTRAQIEEAERLDDVPEMILSGPSAWTSETEDARGHWSRPDNADYDEALSILNRT